MELADTIHVPLPYAWLEMVAVLVVKRVRMAADGKGVVVVPPVK